MFQAAPGQLIENRYQLVELLGEGGHARVYRGEDTASGRPIVIKLLDGTHTPSELARFNRELGLIGQLRDPHTVRLFAHGAVAGTPYIVYEQVPGRSLSSIIAEGGPMPVEIVEHLLRQLCQALAEAHAIGVVHRGVCPQAIRIFSYMNDPWTLKLCDFALAQKFGDEHTQITIAGELVGAPRYMSPEQLLDEAVTPASDVYAIGLLAVELLCGPSGLTGETLAEQARRLNHGFALPPVAAASRLAPMLTRVLSRRPDERPNSAAQLLSLLAIPAKANAPAAARPVPSAPTQTGANLRVWGAIGVLGAIVAGVAVAMSWPAPEATPVPVPKPSAGGESLTKSARRQEAVVAPPIEVPASDGCGLGAPFVGKATLAVTVGLSRRSWPTFVPSSYDGEQRVPLVVLLHQAFETADEFMVVSGFNELAQTEGFVVVAPSDKDSVPWKDASDLDWVAEVVDETKNALCIDPGRVFVVGQGQGGSAATRLSCAEWVTGIASSSHRSSHARTDCDERPVPAFLLSPRHSKHVPFDGGPGCPSPMSKPGNKISVRELEEAWRERNHCTGRARRTFKSGKSVCYEWSCDAPLASCHLDGGHNWPGTAQRSMDMILQCDGTPANFPSAERVWEFFSVIPVQ